MRKSSEKRRVREKRRKIGGPSGGSSFRSPFPDFPLCPASNGYWQEKIAGNRTPKYFGRWGRVVNGSIERLPDDGWQAALELYKASADRGFTDAPADNGGAHGQGLVQPLPHVQETLDRNRARFPPARSRNIRELPTGSLPRSAGTATLTTSGPLTLNRCGRTLPRHGVRFGLATRSRESRRCSSTAASLT